MTDEPFIPPYLDGDMQPLPPKEVKIYGDFKLGDNVVVKDDYFNEKVIKLQRLLPNKMYKITKLLACEDWHETERKILPYCVATLDNNTQIGIGFLERIISN